MEIVITRKICNTKYNERTDERKYFFRSTIYSISLKITSFKWCKIYLDVSLDVGFSCATARSQIGKCFYNLIRKCLFLAKIWSFNVMSDQEKIISFNWNDLLSVETWHRMDYSLYKTDINYDWFTFSSIVILHQAICIKCVYFLWIDFTRAFWLSHLNIFVFFTFCKWDLYGAKGRWTNSVNFITVLTKFKSVLGSFSRKHYNWIFVLQIKR